MIVRPDCGVREHRLDPLIKFKLNEIDVSLGKNCEEVGETGEIGFRIAPAGPPLT